MQDFLFARNVLHWEMWDIISRRQSARPIRRNDRNADASGSHR